MENIFEKLFYDYKKESIEHEFINKLETEMEANKKRLKKHLGIKQKKLLLRIEDVKDLITEESNLESFIEGFKIGLKIGYETNKD